MRTVFSLLLLLLYVAPQAQESFIRSVDVDSAKTALAQSKDDTTKIALYASLGFGYIYVNQDTAIRYATEGLALAKQLHFVRGEAYLLVILGEALAIRGKLAKGLELKLEALRKAETLSDSILLGMANNYVGANYTYSQDWATALRYYNKAKAISIFQRTYRKYLFGQIGACYLGLNNLDSAYYYTKLAYDLDLKDADHWGNLYMNMGNIEASRGNDNKALQYYRTESAIANSPSIGLVSLLHKTGQRDSALYYGKKMLAEKDANFIYRLRATGLLAELYKSNQQYDSAFKYQELTLALKDSIYSQEKVKQLKNMEASEQLRQFQLEQERREVQQQFATRLRMYILVAGLVVLSLIAFTLWRNNRHKQRTNAILVEKNNKIETTLSELKATQAQLIQSEKMASLGELTAGIAHEIQNPLNFVNNFSETNTELLEELETEFKAGNTNEGYSILTNIKENEQKINQHGKRADSIVKGMMLHARTNTGEKQQTDINALVDEYLRLAYHGFRAKDKDFNATFKTHFDESIGKINIIPQDIGRVLLNLFNNAFYAIGEKKKQAGNGYEPKVIVSTERINDKIEITVSDNGNGIPQNAHDKIFQPFFTTKPTGEGTGLGLSLSYDIVKAHGGELKVESTEGEGAEFTILLPLA